MLNRERVEKEYSPLYQKFRMGTCIWSPLASGNVYLFIFEQKRKYINLSVPSPHPNLTGLLTGKYNDGVIPPYSRLAIQDHPVINRLRAGFFSDEGRRKIEKIKLICVSLMNDNKQYLKCTIIVITNKLLTFPKRYIKQIAQRLGCTPAQLSIAWCLRCPHVSSVIIGASTPEQAKENIQALKIRHLLTDEVVADMERVKRKVFGESI